MKRVDIVNAIYNAYDEDARLTKSRNGQLESITTMRYIHALLPEGARVLEVGAGTGRYSVALAREGCDVSAVELVERNLGRRRAIRRRVGRCLFRPLRHANSSIYFQ